jgi:PAS domain S-box-containing protein
MSPLLGLAGASAAALLALGVLGCGARRLRARGPEVGFLGRELFQHAAEGIYLIDATGRVLHANARACGDLGRAPGELIGRDWREIDADAMRGPLCGEPVERQLRHRNGERIPFELRGVRVMLRSRAATLLFARSVAERNAAAARLRTLDDELQRVQRLAAAGRVAGGIAHEFGNLLLVITGLAQLALQRTPSESDVRRDLEEICTAADRAAQLTRELHVLASQQAVGVRPVALNELLLSLEGLLDRLLGERVTLRLELGEPLGSVRVDPGQLEQGVVDLVLNARDATLPDGGEVLVATAVIELPDGGKGALRPGRYAALRVVDHGANADGASAHPFEPSFSADEYVGRGGLDLAFVRRLAVQAGGEVQAHSQPGKGTRIELLLPLVEG